LSETFQSTTCNPNQGFILNYQHDYEMAMQVSSNYPISKNKSWA